MPSRETGGQRAIRHEQAPSQKEQTRQPKAEAEVTEPAGPLGDKLDSSFGSDSFRRDAALLSDPRLAHPANAGPRQAIAQNLQRRRGNSYLRRLVEHVSPTDAGAFQPKLAIGEAGQVDQPVRVQPTKVSSSGTSRR